MDESQNQGTTDIQPKDGVKPSHWFSMMGLCLGAGAVGLVLATPTMIIGFNVANSGEESLLAVGGAVWHMFIGPMLPFLLIGFAAALGSRIPGCRSYSVTLVPAAIAGVAATIPMALHYVSIWAEKLDYDGLASAPIAFSIGYAIIGMGFAFFWIWRELRPKKEDKIIE